MSRVTHSVLAGGLAMCLAVAARAQLTNFTTIDYPGSTYTVVSGLNDAGEIVGSYIDRNQRRHGLLIRDGRFTVFDFPGVSFTLAADINAAGDIVGFYLDANNIEHGFLLSGGRFTTVDFPGAERTRAFGINAKGEMVGLYRKGEITYGFLLSGGFTSIQYPDSVLTVACGINDHGEIVGRWQDAAKKIRGFRLSRGNFTSFEFPGAQATMIDSGRINNNGDIVGPYTDARGKTRGFLLSGGRYTSFDVPGSTNTQGRKINAAGQITGIYYVSGRYYGFVTTLAPPSTSQPILVDDDGADCPGAVTTIQEAVRRASSGANILVCRGIYTGTVGIAGAEKDGVKLIALGRAGEVILQGDYLARDGFHLQNVSNVLIRGFLVRDFGEKATTASEWGVGNLVYLENAHYNTIEHNQFANPDRAAVLLVDSASNVIQHNVTWADNAALATSGVEVRGTKSANNVISLNMSYGNKLAGVMLSGAGAGNVVRDNTIVANGRYGIDIQNTPEAWVEGNRVSYNRGFWGTTPGGQQPGVGINLANLLKATVFDNRARGNTGADLNWDGKGDNRVEANACDTCVPASACGK